MVMLKLQVILFTPPGLSKIILSKTALDNFITVLLFCCTVVVMDLCIPYENPRHLFHHSLSLG